jgi:hypothetical protein
MCRIWHRRAGHQVELVPKIEEGLAAFLLELGLP